MMLEPRGAGAEWQRIQTCPLGRLPRSSRTLTPETG